MIVWKHTGFVCHVIEMIEWHEAWRTVPALCGETPRYGWWGSDDQKPDQLTLCRKCKELSNGH